MDRSLGEEKWRSSGITDEQAELLQLEVIDGDTAQNMSANFYPVTSLKIPYWDLDGRLTQFYRLRYLESLPGFAGQAAKPQRYAQAPGTLNEVYYPPLLPTPWRSVAADPNIPIYITEGELKAAAGCGLGLAVLGLGGVDVWRSTKRGVSLLPSLEDIQWARRSVIIVFDSDAASNPHVLRAQLQLCRELTNRGAMPQIASLPPRVDGGKQGLDDFLVAYGAEALISLLEDAPAHQEAAALWELNEEVAYIRDPGLIVVRSTGQKLSANNFVGHAYSNRHYIEIQMTKKGAVANRRPLAKRWLDWERRFELDRVTYLPGKPQVYEGQWNEWPGWGVEPKRGDVKPWQELLQFVFQDDTDARRWFEMWCAYPMQYPGTKLFTSVVMWGVHHGTGKTLVGYTLRNIYGKNAVEIGDRELHAAFNEWQQNRQFVIGNEVTGSDRKAEADRLKGLITQEDMRINAKYVPAYSLPDCVNYYFTSNHPDAFFLEDTDRRNFVHEVVGTPLDPAFYAKYDEWLKKGGAAHLFYHLLKLDVSDFNPKGAALMTKSKAAMIRDTKSDIGSWVNQLKEYPEAALLGLGVKVAAECALLTTGQLLFAYDPLKQGKVTLNGLARELKRAGFRQANGGTPISVLGGPQRLWVVRDLEVWSKKTNRELAMHWNTYNGPNATKY